MQNIGFLPAESKLNYTGKLRPKKKVMCLHVAQPDHPSKTSPTPMSFFLKCEKRCGNRDINVKMKGERIFDKILHLKNVKILDLDPIDKMFRSMP